MEENQVDQPLFSLSIDPVTKSTLIEASRWARILAIAAIFCILIVVAGGIYQIIVLSQFDEILGRSFDKARTTVIISYLLLLAGAFFPIVYMLRFASKMKIALESNDQDAFNAAFLNLKIYFRYLAIVTLIGLVLFALSIFLGVVGGATLTRR